MMEYRIRCALYGEPGHQLHQFYKVSEGSALRTADGRNHQGELDAKKPPSERYMDHTCTPYVPESREPTPWKEIT